MVKVSAAPQRRPDSHTRVRLQSSTGHARRSSAHSPSKIQAMTKMGMLRSGITEPLPPDPFELPLSRYKETRLKSTKDLVNMHGKQRMAQPEFFRPKAHDESLYTTTTHHPSPAKRAVENPESPPKLKASFVDTREDEDEHFDQDRYNVFHKLKMGYVSPMKGMEEENFIDRLKDWLRLETYIDSIKEELILYNEDFGPVQAFRIFVQKPDKGRNITINNLRDAYELLGVPLSSEEAHLVMMRIDANRDGVLTYTDICDVFRPKNLALAREFGQRMPMELQTSQMISFKATKLIKKLFASFVKVENFIEDMKKSLLGRVNFDLAKAFSVLNMEGEKDGFDKISVEELQGILKRHGFIAFSNEVSPLFTRFDKDKDGLVAFGDFRLEIEPVGRR
jgi:Ca2+-binding EF-hand superfamily protein